VVMPYFKVQSWNLRGDRGGNHKSPIQDSWYPGQDSRQVPWMQVNCSAAELNMLGNCFIYAHICIHNIFWECKQIIIVSIKLNIMFVFNCMLHIFVVKSYEDDVNDRVKISCKLEFWMWERYFVYMGDFLMAIKKVALCTRVFFKELM